MIPKIKYHLLTHLLLVWINIIISNQFIYGQRHYFIEESFSQRNPTIHVNQIYQEPSGLIWLGTSSGLFSYDGINHQILDKSEGFHIACLSPGLSDSLLAGTIEGDIIIIELQNRSANVLESDSVHSKITGIVYSEDQIIISTYGDGLWLIENEKWQRISGISDYSIVEIYDMEVDKQGRIFLGTDDGLCIIETLNKKCKFLTVDQGLPDNIVKVVQADQQGNIWLGFHQNGFCQLQNDQVVSISQDWINGAVATINTQMDGYIFIGTDDGTLLQYKLSSEETGIILEPGKSTFHIDDILVDKEANLWVSDQQNGLNRTSLFFSFIDLPGSFKNKNVQAIFMDLNNRLWFTTEDGLYEATFGGVSPTFTKHLDSDIYGSTFISLYGDGTSIWVGTFGVGVLYYDPVTKVVQSFKEKQGLANDNVLSIAASDEKIWFATLGGASEAAKEDFGAGKPVVFNNYHDEDGLGTEYIYQVMIDSKGNPWFATDGKGLVTLKNGEFVNYNAEDGLQSKVIYSLTEDTNNNIWLGTPKNGIYKFDGQQFENYIPTNGFDTKQISALDAVDQNLIVIHKLGIDLLHENELRSFGLTEGIGEINPDLNAVTKDISNNLWIGHQDGIIIMNTQLKGNYQPEILINKILVNLNTLDETSGRTFTFDENYLTFNYLGLWYSDPMKIRYEYKLEGINQDWISSRDNFVTFPNLPSGKYTFFVRASVNNDFENSNMASYQFTILAPYWETAWFYLLLIISVSLVVGSIFYFRDKNLKKKALIEQEKIQFQFETLKNQINPHFLFNSFNTLISIIEEEPTQATEYVENLSDFFRNILQLREKDTISLKEEIELTMAYAYLQEKRFGSNFSLQINIPDQWLETAIPPLTIQLLTENAIKHNVISDKKPLSLRIYIDDGFVVVRNEIQLKSKSGESTHYGLENIIKRYQLLSKVPVEILKDEFNFIVKLPLINQ